MKTRLERRDFSNECALHPVGRGEGGGFAARAIATALLCLGMAVNAFAAELVIESLDGPLTPKEVSSFKAFMKERPTSGDNIGNDWVYGNSGKDTEALGMMFEITRDPEILDQMIRFADAALACRNHSETGRTVWTGKRELCWPNRTENVGDGKYSGSENGDVIAHIGYCAKLILQSPALWSAKVPIGDPQGNGATYKERAMTYIRETDRSIDTFVLPWFVRAADRNRYLWPDSDLYRALGPRYQSAPNNPIPWNQQTMLSGGFLRLAECHEILKDDPERVKKYYEIVRSNMEWFLSDLHPYEREGRTVYDWGYSAGRRSEDVPHGGYDIWGLWRAFEHGGFGVSAATMTNFANTLRYVIYDSTNKVFHMRVDGRSPGDTRPRTGLGGSWTPLAEFFPGPELYRVIGEANRAAAATRPLEFAFLMREKHRRNALAR